MTNQAMDHLPRNERRLLLKAEARNRRSGNWGEWEVFGFAKGTVNKNQKSWAYHFDKAYRNQVFSVLERALPDGVRHLAVSSLSGSRPTWWEMQRIKCEIAGDNATAVEVYPPATEVIDEADMYHIWVLPDPLPFVLREVKP